jgi:hypothetical protein
MIFRGVTALAVLSLLAGCSILPQDGGRPCSDATAPDLAAKEQGLLICELAGRDSVVRVLASNAGTRYTLCDERGSPIATNLQGAALAALRPDLDPRRMHADGSFELMMVETAD